MKKYLLLSVLAAAVSGVSAANELYYSSDVMAEARAVSPQGKYAVFSDPDNDFSYIWSAESPEVFTLVMNPDDPQSPAKFTAYDVNDAGTVVGALKKTYESRVYYQPVIYKDGQFINLDAKLDAVTDKGETLVGNYNYAIAISADERIICGKIPAKPGFEDMAYPSYPCIWELQENGEYELHLYNDIDNLPEHQGFFPNCMTSDGTIEGTVIGGTLCGGAGSTVPAIVKNGKLIYWNTFETRDVTMDTKWGPKTWPCEFVDGFQDGWNGDYFEGGFFSVDGAGNFYGYKSQVIVPADGMPENGEVSREVGACIYNDATGVWDYTSGASTYLCGVDKNYIFNLRAEVLVDGTANDILPYFNVADQAQGISFSGIAKANFDGHVLIGQHSMYNPATGQADPYPLVITLDAPLVGVEAVEADSAVTIRGLEGAIAVEGAASVAIYDLQGRLVSTSANAQLASGIYVVKADNTTCKVIVK